MRAFRIAYDGRPFSGFQRQPDVRTVEGELFAACRALGICEAEPAGYSAAGRTDAGVSALAQTVAFEAPDWCTPATLNGQLPDAIQAWASADVSSDFHAIRDAGERTYRYHRHAPHADDERARRAAAALSGEHDFHNLTTDDDITVRDVALEVVRDGAFLVLTATAAGFSRQLVRRLASLIDAVAAGDRSMAAVERALADAPLTGAAGIPPAPPEPLVLTEVVYDVAFDRDADALEAARRAFRSQRVEHLAGVRVADAVLGGLRPADG